LKEHLAPYFFPHVELRYIILTDGKGEKMFTPKSVLLEAGQQINIYNLRLLEGQDIISFEVNDRKYIFTAEDVTKWESRLPDVEKKEIHLLDTSVIKRGEWLTLPLNEFHVGITETVQKECQKDPNFLALQEQFNYQFSTFTKIFPHSRSRQFFQLLYPYVYEGTRYKNSSLFWPKDDPTPSDENLDPAWCRWDNDEALKPNFDSSLNDLAIWMEAIAVAHKYKTKKVVLHSRDKDFLHFDMSNPKIVQVLTVVFPKASLELVKIVVH